MVNGNFKGIKVREIILCTGFKGNKNSSKVLLDNISKSIDLNCLYIDNDFLKSETQLKDKMEEKNMI